MTVKIKASTQWKCYPEDWGKLGTTTNYGMRLGCCMEIMVSVHDDTGKAHARVEGEGGDVSIPLSDDEVETFIRIWRNRNQGIVLEYE